MSTPTPPGSTPASAPASTPGTNAPNPPPTNTVPSAAEAKPIIAPHADSKAGQYPRPAIEPLPGWKGAFEYTGIPRSWLMKKPRQLLPGRKMSIFLTVVGGLTWIWYEDRKECKRIKGEYIAKVEGMAKEAMKGSFELPRKVTVYAARWPDDDEADRGLKYFRKYVKPYLSAAAIDYDQVHAPLYGSVARIVRKDILRTRRENLGLQPHADTVDLGLPPQVAAERAAAAAARATDGGVVLIGRPTLKEYLAGVKAGWGNGVSDWVWENDVESAIANDGVFDQPKLDTEFTPEPEFNPDTKLTPAHLSPAGRLLSRQVPPPPPPATVTEIPPQLHEKPNPMPPTPAVLLVPWTNHLGFLQIPWMMYDFFTERKKVRSGAEAAYALITDQVRPITPNDLDFDKRVESYYKGAYSKLPKRYEEARGKYYGELEKKIESARQFARGERDLTDEEKKSDKPVVTEDDLRAERKKRELRWFGGLEGYDIVRPESQTAWDDDWVGWLNVFGR